MVRAAGQGHGRNDAATTDPQPSTQGLLRALGPQASDFGGSAWSGLQAWAGASRGLGPGPTRAWGLGLGARVSERLPKVFRRSEKSPVIGLWRRGGSQLNNYDETRSDHGPVGITWLCYILVTIDYATYL